MVLELDEKYVAKLDALATEIQESDELAAYLDTEEDDDYNRLKEMYEPRISMIYEDVAAENPLQLVSYEKALLNPRFEGLYLPKLLGFSVLRGYINERFKYEHPQNHFKDVLMAICNSANFDILRKRIGQSIQMGFSLSSDIWITNLISPITNRRIKYFLQGQKLEKYRVEANRRSAYTRYLRQFKNDNFQSADFPETTQQLKVLFLSLKSFLIHRINKNKDNKSIIPHIKTFLERDIFQGTNEHLQVMSLYTNFFKLNEDDQDHLFGIFNKVRQANPNFTQEYLEFLLEMHRHKDLYLDAKADRRASTIVDKSVDDDLTKYYNLTDIIHSKGYNQEPAQEAVKVFYHQYEGLSVINHCVRNTIFTYFQRFVQNLEEREYPDYFEITKIFTVYIDIFRNQKFTQALKVLSMKYIRRLLKKFTDKRGKDYQDIKKFVSVTFIELGFLKDKEVVELFKTRRTRKKPAKK